MKSVYLALGSNLGDREAYLQSGIGALAAHGLNITRCASVYSSEPCEVLDQPWFLNTALEAITELDPETLLNACLDVETENHRDRRVSKGPRTLDIDIIFYGDEIIRKPHLTIPHPSFSSRRFVLLPLVEIATDFVDPVSQKTIGEILEQCPDRSQVVRLG